ncbi:MAG: hypothetical protein BGO55_06160 [Sphingobacteriales bacterium 50-39]|nr:hypothetical protein [Sphingobacteriales bacterium]OJW52847.1 MAG: hypothetical protein BGO55_06160 [Sphingobacteriales bacterium 50-39]
MLKVISWNQYFLFAGVAAAAWYAYVFLRYAVKPAREKASSFTTKDRSALFGAPIEAPANESHSDQDLEISDKQAASQDLGLVTQTVIQEIKSAIAEGADEGVSDDELVARVRVVLSNYPELRSTAYGSMVKECIIREGQAVGFDWTADEVEDFWN